MRKRLLCCVACILLLSLSGCLSEEFLPKNKRLPKDGIWYCETLQMQLGFGESGESESETWVILNGEKILCDRANLRGESTLWIIAADTAQLGELKTTVERTLFGLEIVSVSEDTIIVKDRDTNESHTFVKME